MTEAANVEVEVKEKKHLKLELKNLSKDGDRGVKVTFNIKHPALSQYKSHTIELEYKDDGKIRYNLEFFNHLTDNTPGSTSKFCIELFTAVKEWMEYNTPFLGVVIDKNKASD